MRVREVLNQLDLGNSVAEHDAALERYFVETETFRDLIADRGDIIAGDKGTGKTAMYRILKDRYRAIPELSTVEVLSGFNPAGNPVFQRLAEADPLEEGQYTTVWKAYVLSLIGNWLLSIWEPVFTEPMEELDSLLRKIGLRSKDDDPNTVFSRLIRTVRRFLNPESAEAEFTFDASGIPVLRARLNLGPEGSEEPEPRRVIPHREALNLLNRVLDETETTVWLVLDRLDEAFTGYPDVEVPALRALLRTYLDLAEFERIRLKLFVRNDLFRKVIRGGFVNLTHVNARKIEIVWDDEDLLNLLCRRVRESHDFMGALGVNGSSNEELFYSVFPRQVDVGERKPTTWSWMRSRIRDGNDVKAPRNLIDLAQKGQDAQLRREEREDNEFRRDEPVIRSEAIKRGLEALSTARVEDTLLAEAGEYSPYIERFRDGKAEHNDATLSEILGVEPEGLEPLLRGLSEIGFIEQSGENYKVPMLYRDGLGITQGKAF